VYVFFYSKLFLLNYPPNLENKHLCLFLGLPGHHHPSIPTPAVTTTLRYPPASTTTLQYLPAATTTLRYPPATTTQPQNEHKRLFSPGHHHPSKPTTTTPPLLKGEMKGFHTHHHHALPHHPSISTTHHKPLARSKHKTDGFSHPPPLTTNPFLARKQGGGFFLLEYYIRILYVNQIM